VPLLWTIRRTEWVKPMDKTGKTTQEAILVRSQFGEMLIRLNRGWWPLRLGQARGSEIKEVMPY